MTERCKEDAHIEVVKTCKGRPKAPWPKHVSKRNNGQTRRSDSDGQESAWKQPARRPERANGQGWKTNSEDLHVERRGELRTARNNEDIKNVSSFITNTASGQQNANEIAQPEETASGAGDNVDTQNDNLLDDGECSPRDTMHENDNAKQRGSTNRPSREILKQTTMEGDPSDLLNHHREPHDEPSRPNLKRRENNKPLRCHPHPGVNHTLNSNKTPCHEMIRQPISNPRTEQLHQCLIQLLPSERHTIPPGNSMLLEQSNAEFPWRIPQLCPPLERILLASESDTMKSREHFTPEVTLADLQGL
ncbi:hypothetical protein R1flu_002848 [Riccia fluitans]|uniref:Uncharacterized protein n=1 Tax=Riccia fluitans TaxID=41844 RepID=A0ABD1Y7B0_9MARC